MIVYVTQVGTAYEGLSLSGVFSTLDAAKAFIDSEERSDWQEICEVAVDGPTFPDWFDWEPIWLKDHRDPPANWPAKYATPDTEDTHD